MASRVPTSVACNCPPTGLPSTSNCWTTATAVNEPPSADSRTVRSTSCVEGRSEAGRRIDARHRHHPGAVELKALGRPRRRGACEPRGGHDARQDEQARDHDRNSLPHCCHLPPPISEILSLGSRVSFSLRVALSVFINRHHTDP